MMLGAAEVLAILKEYGLAGVMAWLFWWTLRRLMASHDATVCQLKEQLDAESQATRAAGENFSKVVENHMAHVCDALGRFDAALGHHTTDQKRWQDRLLEMLDRISERLAAERRAGVIRSRDWVESAFGKFAWEDDPGRRGAVRILGEWERRNIVLLDPPFEVRDGRGRPISTIRCHGLVAPALGRVLADLMRRNLCHLVNTFDGCFVPRHMGWDPRRALSRHAWGIAVDVNARMFPYGSEAKQNRRLVEAFKRQGFAWGGEWRTPDPMHFEIVDLAQPARPLSIVVDGERVVDGFIYEGRAVAPIREVVEAIGARVEARVSAGEVEVFSPGYTPE